MLSILYFIYRLLYYFIEKNDLLLINKVYRVYKFNLITYEIEFKIYARSELFISEIIKIQTTTHLTWFNNSNFQFLIAWELGSDCTSGRASSQDQYIVICSGWRNGSVAVVNRTREQPGTIVASENGETQALSIGCNADSKHSNELLLKPKKVCFREIEREMCSQNGIRSVSYNDSMK